MTSSDNDLSLAGAIALTLVALDELGNPLTFRLPYPPRAQHTFDRVVLQCLLDEADPPNSVPGLVKWCHERPLSQWPLALPDRVFSSDSFLLNGESGVLTELCYELALVAESCDPFKQVMEAMDTAAALCRQQHDQVSYGNLRGLLVEKPVLDNDGLNTVAFSDELGQLDFMIEKLYHRVPASYLHDGKCRSCGSCKHLMMPLGAQKWWCERNECREQAENPVGLTWNTTEGEVFQLDRRHRQFVASPGRATLRLFARLEELGLRGDNEELELWADFGTYDLKIVFPDEHTWGLRMADWHNPSLLGMAATPLTGDPQADEVFWVVPDYRTSGEPEYIDTFNRFRAEKAQELRLYSEGAFVSRVRDRLRRCGKG